MTSASPTTVTAISGSRSTEPMARRASSTPRNLRSPDYDGVANNCSAHQCRLGGPIRPRTIRLVFRNQPGHQRYRDGTSLTRLRRTGPRCMGTPQSGLRNRRSDRPRHTSQPDEGSPFSFPASLHELIYGASITFFDVVGWGDQPL